MSTAAPTGALEMRLLTSADADAVAAIHARLTGIYNPEHWRHRLKACEPYPQLALGAEIDGKLVGVIIGRISEGDFGIDGLAGWIDYIAVDPSYQRWGIGSTLLEAIINRFRRWSVQKVFSLVNWRNGDMLSLLNSWGFRHTEHIHLERDLY